ncbi:MAG: hypothetical protein PHE20_00180 [Patescibacteria group bacterium]|nr:hypothetical protein [Patescibacteria group bacterium]
MFILGILIIAVGTFLVLKTEWFMDNFGRMAWFEDKLGSDGGSRLGYKLVGIVAIFIGIVLLSGNGSNFFTWMLSPLIPEA